MLFPFDCEDLSGDVPQMAEGAVLANSYFVSSVGGAPLSVIKQYIEKQKNV